MSESREIRCIDTGGGCGKLLAKTSGASLTIVCPRCNRPHVVPIIELVAALSEYLQSVQAMAEKDGSGKGFML